MRNFLRASETSLGTFIRSCDQFVLPANQRNYEWGKNERDDFWADIWHVVLNDCPFYFLGSFVLDSAGAPQLVIIDGQQRMTTSAILVAALRNMLLQAGKEERAQELTTRFLVVPEREEGVRLSLNMIDRAFFENYIVKPVEIAALRVELNKNTLPESNKNMGECLIDFTKKIMATLKDSADYDIESLSEIIARILDERVGLIRIDVEGDLNAFTVFETLNDRGLVLNSADLLKNHLVAVAQSGSVQAVRDWDVMATNLAQIDYIDFLMHHWNSTRNYLEKRNLYKDIKGAMVTQDEVVHFCRNLASESFVYAALFDMQHSFWSSYSEEDRRAICAYLDFIRQMKTKPQYIILLSVMVVNPEAVLSFLEMLAHFIFRYTKVCNHPPSKVENVFANAAKEIRQTPTVSALQIFEQYFAELYPDDAEFVENFIVYKKKEPGLLRYILASINDAMEGLPERSTLNNPEACSLEHVLPIKYSAEWGERPEGFPEGAENFVWRLGNMTLLSKESNGQIGNVAFVEKLSTYQENPLAISQDILRFSQWDAQAIEERQRAMAQVAVQLWHYPRQT